MNLMNLLTAFILSAMFLSSCGETKKMQRCKIYSKMEFEHDKGFQYIHFDVVPHDEENFNITNIKYRFSEQEIKSHENLKISASDNEKIFSALKDIFSGNCELSWKIPAPYRSHAVTGDHWYRRRLFYENDSIEEFDGPNNLIFVLKDKTKFYSYLLPDYVVSIVKPKNK